MKKYGLGTESSREGTKPVAVIMHGRRMGIPASLLLLVAGLLIFGHTVSAYDPPTFSVRYDGTTRFYNTPTQTNGNQRIFDYPPVYGVITDIGNDIWRLELTNQSVSTTFTTVYFPWQQNSYLIDNSEDYFVYSTHIIGKRISNTNGTVWAWKNWGSYPGLCAPILVAANDTKAKLVAAVNWPPVKVTPSFSLNRLIMQYPELPPSSNGTYQVLIKEVEGDASEGNVPWMLAVDEYKKWLQPYLIEEDVYPLPNPDWLKEIQGFIQENLSDRTGDAPYSTLPHLDKWKPWLAYFPWLQLWGQMSYYAETGGCCLVRPTVHERWYTPTNTNDYDLIDYAQEVKSIYGCHYGYYSRVEPAYEEFISDPYKFLDFVDWNETNETEYEANAFYYDVMGRAYHGEPLAVMEFLRDDERSQDAMIEGSVDIYPSAGLVSGCLDAGYPQFGRYLLDSHLIFMGYCNGDFSYSGPSKDYVAERNAFLLGAKFDTHLPFLSYQATHPSVATNWNQGLRAVYMLREDSDWWAREPQYLHRRGLHNIPFAGGVDAPLTNTVDVRRFIDRNGVNLLAVLNYNSTSSLSFDFYDKTINIPTNQYFIIDVPQEPRGDLVGHWTFNETSGSSVYDDSWRATTGTVYGAVTRTNSGARGGALIFDGDATDYVAVPDLPSPTSYTITGWLRRDAGDSSDRRIAHRDLTVSSTNGKGLLIKLFSNDYLYAYQSVNQSIYAVTVHSSMAFPSDGEYHHFAVTFDNDDGTCTLKLYVDSVLKGTHTTTGTPDYASTASSLVFGKYMSGGLDDIRYYSRALEPEEIATEMAMEAVLPLNVAEQGQTNSVLYDMSGNDYDAWFTGSASIKWFAGRTGLEINDRDAQDVRLSGLPSPTSYSLSCWVKVDSSSENVASRMIARRELVVSASSGNGLLLQLYSDNRLWAYQSIDGNIYKGKVCSAEVFPHDGQYHHVAVCFDNDNGTCTLKLYIDGVLSDSSTQTGTPDYASSGSVMQLGTGSFQGSLADARFFNRALTSDEVETLSESSY